MRKYSLSESIILATFSFFTICIIELILPFSEAAVIAEAKAEEETEKACCFQARPRHDHRN